MSTICETWAQWHIRDLPAGDPDEATNLALIRRLFDHAYNEWVPPTNSTEDQ